MSPAPGGPTGAADPAPARPRRPRRHAEVRLRRRPRRPRAGVGPRDGGPGRRRRAAPRRCCAASGVERHQPRRRSSARVATRRASAARRRPTWRGRRVAGALLRRRGRGGDDRRDQGGGEGRRLASAASSRCSAYGVPVGLGSHVHWDRKLDGLLAQALDEHPGGEGGRDRRRLSRSQAAGAPRPTTRSAGTRRRSEYRRESDRAGGIEGGITTGALLVGPRVHEAAGDAQPARRSGPSTSSQGGDASSFKERTDVTAVPAMGVVAETMMALRPGLRGAAQVRRRLACAEMRAQQRRLPCAQPR